MRTDHKKRAAKLEAALVEIIAYRDREPHTLSTSAPSRMEEEAEVWDRARRLVNKPWPPGPCAARNDDGAKCTLLTGHMGPHRSVAQVNYTW